MDGQMDLSPFLYTHTHTHTHSPLPQNHIILWLKYQGKSNFYSYPFPVSCSTGHSRTEYKALTSLLRRRKNGKLHSVTSTQGPGARKECSLLNLLPQPNLILHSYLICYLHMQSFTSKRNAPVQRPHLWQTGVAMPVNM